MKKWMKRLLVVGAVSVLLGLGMILAGTFMGGSARVEKTIVFEEEALDLAEEWLDKEDGYFFEEIRSMEIESVGLTQIVETPDLMPGQVHVMERGEGSEYRILKEDGSLRVLLPSHWDHKNWNHQLAKKEVIIYIPESYEFEEIDIEQVAGRVQAEQLFAGELSLKVVSGSMEIGGGKAEEVETECISGSLICLAAASESASVENISGLSKIALEGSRDDYDYEITRGSGRILLNGEQEETYAEHWGERKIDNGTGRQVDFNCVAGKIIVVYTDFMDVDMPLEGEEDFV